MLKATGNLFRYVLEKENIQSHQLYHQGDNPYGDVFIPRQLGIKASHFLDSQLNRYEKQILVNSQTQTYVKSRLAGVSRAVRLMRSDDEGCLSALSNIAANVVAPLLTAYVAWVIQDAQKQGIKRLYFVSRDSQILLKIAQKLAKSMAAPECRYLYGSRQSWFLPAVFPIA